MCVNNRIPPCYFLLYRPRVEGNVSFCGSVLILNNISKVIQYLRWFLDKKEASKYFPYKSAHDQRKIAKGFYFFYRSIYYSRR